MSNTIFDLLNRIQKRPGMYLGYPSISSLFMFLNGYGIARGEVGIDLTPEEECFYDQFQPWLQRKLGIRSVTSWDKLIMLSCNSEKAGFERFFQLLDEFRRREKKEPGRTVSPLTTVPPIPGSVPESQSSKKIYTARIQKRTLSE